MKRRGLYLSLIIILASITIFMISRPQSSQTPVHPPENIVIVPAIPKILTIDKVEMVPLHAVAEIVGATVTQDKKTQEITVYYYGNSFTYQNRSISAKQHGNVSISSKEAITRHGTTYVPFVSLVNSLGGTVRHEGDIGYVLASFPKLNKPLSFPYATEKPIKNPLQEIALMHSIVELYVMNIDGSGIRRLTYNTIKDEYPAFSPDGQQMVYRRDESIYFRRCSEPNETMLCSGEYDAIRYDLASFSPDGSSIIYVAYSPNANHELWDANIYRMKINGGKAQHLAQGDCPNVSPDGKLIAYQNLSERTEWISTICLMNDNGTNIRRIGEGIPSPLFSPSGLKLCFPRRYNFNNTYAVSLVTYQVAGRNSGRSYQTEIHEDSGAVCSWCFSPDETQLFFCKIGRATIKIGEPVMKGEGIYSMNSDGSNLHQLTRERVISPLALTADGKRILYVKDNNLCSIRIDGTDFQQITSNELLQFGFRMAPDNHHILFLSYPELVTK